VKSFSKNYPPKFHGRGGYSASNHGRDPAGEGRKTRKIRKEKKEIASSLIKLGVSDFQQFQCSLITQVIQCSQKTHSPSSD
jgi:hypothetical protein